MARKPKITLYIDGGARGNPGPAACAAVLQTADDGQTVLEQGEYLGETTNNVAEYRGLLLGLRMAAQLGADEIEIRSDSELLVRQLAGRYRVRSEALKALHAEALQAIRRFGGVEVRHVRREENAEADRLVNQTLNAHARKPPTAGGRASPGRGKTFRLE